MSLYVSGYELTLLSSPRSMRGTAMGIFYCLDGFASLISIATTLVATAVEYFMIAGAAATIVGIVVLIVVEKKVGLGLSRV